MTCINPSVAADLANALGPDAHQRLRHVGGCPRCLAAVHEAAMLAEVLTAEIPPDAGFEERVTGRLRMETSSPPPSRGARPWTGWVAGWALAAPTAVGAAAAAGTAVPVSTGPGTLLIAVAWASAMFAWTARASLASAV